jgi:hypothetical protein
MHVYKYNVDTNCILQLHQYNRDRESAESGSEGRSLLLRINFSHVPIHFLDTCIPFNVHEISIDGPGVSPLKPQLQLACSLASDSLASPNHLYPQIRALRWFADL